MATKRKYYLLKTKYSKRYFAVKSKIYNECYTWKTWKKVMSEVLFYSGYTPIIMDVHVTRIGISTVFIIDGEYVPFVLMAEGKENGK